MPFGNSKPRTFIKIKDGNIVAKIGNNENRFGFYEGKLINIKIIEEESNSFHSKQWNVDFLDPNGDVIVWVIDYNAFIFQNFINCISSIDEEFGAIKISPYLYNERSKLSVYNNGEKLSWKYLPEEMPKLEEKKLKNDESINYDNTERMKWIENIVVMINKKLNSQTEDFHSNVNGIENIDSVDENDIPF